MLSTFTTTVRSEVELDLDPDGYKKAKAAFDAEHEPFAEAVAKFEKEKLPGAFAAWEKARGDKPLALGWVLPEVVQTQIGGRRDASRSRTTAAFCVSGKNPTTETLTLQVATDLDGHPVAAPRGAGRSVAGEGRAGPGDERQLRALRPQGDGPAEGQEGPARRGR